MNNLVVIKDAKAVTTSRQVSETFAKEHNIVLRAVRQLDCSENFRLCNFAQSSYINDQNRLMPEYTITRDGFTLLAMGFTGKEAAKFKEQYIAAFNAMEDALKKQQPAFSTLDMLELAIKNMREQGQELSELKNEVKALKAGAEPDYFTIMGFSALKGFHVTLYEAAAYGKMAKRICNARGYTIDTIPDPRFGRINLYPKEVLEEVLIPKF